MAVRKNLHKNFEPEVLRLLGEESKRRGTDTLTSRQISRVIKTARAQKAKR